MTERQKPAERGEAQPAVIGTFDPVAAVPLVRRAGDPQEAPARFGAPQDAPDFPGDWNFGGPAIMETAGGRAPMFWKQHRVTLKTESVPAPPDQPAMTPRQAFGQEP
jgi:hypothetical protein